MSTETTEETIDVRRIGLISLELVAGLGLMGIPYDECIQVIALTVAGMTPENRVRFQALLLRFVGEMDLIDRGRAGA